ncbi:tetratricopeptide repeat-containing sensor histidine kinase [Marinifilum sp. RC60d5]|uniref:tetratricopeptide repeat-containing sensor histidine kinase n=1 Tax=Marinifilum sp. RC60d5 TaxID=3458414 RepID=UPI0040354726
MRYISLIILFFCYNLFVAQAQIDSLENLLSQKNGLEKVKILNELSYSYYNSNPEKGIEHAKEAYEIAFKLDSKSDLAKSLQNLGINYWAEGELDKALEYFNKALPMYVELKDFRGKASVLSCFGVVYKNLSDFDNSLEYYFKSLEICEQRNYTDMSRKTLGNISLVYLGLNNYDKALAYIQEAISLRDSLGGNKILPAHLNTMGQIYEAKKDYDNAQLYYNKSLKENIKNNDQYGVTICLYNIGNAKFYLKNYEEAKMYFQKSLAVSSKISDQIGILYANKSIGLVCAIQGKNNLALSYYDKAKDLAKTLKAKEQQFELYRNYSDIYKSQGNYKKALEYFELSSSLNDSIYNEKSSRQIAEMETKYASHKKEKENELLRKNSKIQNLEITKQTQFRNAIIVLLVLVILLVFILLNQFKIKKDANAILSEKNMLVEKHKLELEQKNKILTKQFEELQLLNATKDKFFKIISHDLKGPFNSILGFSDLLNTDYKLLSDKERIAMLKEIDKSSKFAYELLLNLLTWAQAQMNEIKINKELLNLKDLVDTTVSLYGLNASCKNIDIVVDVPESIVLPIDEHTSMIFMGNLINNAIKFTPDGGLISITTTSKEDYVQIHILDTGVGMSPEVLQKLFKIDENISTEGTNNEKGTGLGLILCKEFIEQNEGTISVKSTIGKGSEFIITMPKNND